MSNAHNTSKRGVSRNILDAMKADIHAAQNRTTTPKPATTRKPNPGHDIAQAVYKLVPLSGYGVGSLSDGTAYDSITLHTHQARIITRDNGNLEWWGVDHGGNKITPAHYINRHSDAIQNIVAWLESTRDHRGQMDDNNECTICGAHLADPHNPECPNN